MLRPHTRGLPVGGLLLRQRPLPVSRGWKVLAGLSAAQMASWGVLYYAFSVFLRPMEAELGWSRTDTSVAFSLGLLTSALSAPAVGGIIDRRGPRVLMTVGSALGAVLVLAWSRVRTLEALYVIWIGMGVAMAAGLYEPAFAVITKWYGRDRDRALTVLTLVAGLASAVFLPLSTRLVDALGWRDALVVLAVILAAVTIPVHGLVLRTPAAGLTLRREGAPLRDESPAPQVRTEMAPAAAVRTVGFWSLTVAFLLSGLATGALAVHLVPYLVERGHSPMVSALVVGTLGAMQLPGRAFFAPLSSTVSVSRLTAGVFLLQAVALAILTLARGPIGLAAFVLTFGVASGLLTLARVALLADLYGRLHYGSVAGIVAAFTTTARAVGPTIAAGVRETTGSYDRALWMLFAGLLLATAAAVVASRRRPGIQAQNTNDRPTLPST